MTMSLTATLVTPEIPLPLARRRQRGRALSCPREHLACSRLHLGGVLRVRPGSVGLEVERKNRSTKRGGAPRFIPIVTCSLAPLFSMVLRPGRAGRIML